MTKKDEIQSGLTKHILDQLVTILLVSVRVGKTKVALDAIEENDTVLVVYPFDSMVDGWLEDIEKFKPKSTNIEFVTNKSLHKLVKAVKTYSYVIIDEPQKSQSVKQIASLKYFRATAKKFVGLTGSLSSKTQLKFKNELNWGVTVEYSTDNAIKDGLVKDYKIFVHYLDLDDKNPYVTVERFKTTIQATEKRAYDIYTENMEWAQSKQAEDTTFANKYKYLAVYRKNMVARTGLILNSKTLFDNAKKLIQQSADEKVLIYALRTKVADALSSKSYHSKNANSEVLNWFKESIDGHLSAANSIQTGITIKNLSKVIFHSYDSNPETLYQKLARSLLFEYKDEVSEIHLFCLKDTNMEDWLDEGTSSLNPHKINYVIGDVVMPKLEYYKQLYPNLKMFLYKGKVVYESGYDPVLDKLLYSYIKTPDKQYPISKKNLVSF